MTECKNCKYFETNERFSPWTGVCLFEMPSWLKVALNEVRYGDDRIVRGDDSCDLGVDK
jgi:hypothetical protein